PLFVLFSSGADEKKESKKFKFMELLLEYGTDLTLTGPGNESVLTPAILSNSIECVEFLLKKNIDVNVVDRRGRTPFHYAAEQASMEVIKMLLDAGALINVVDNAGKTPLMLAKKNPHKASLTYLQKESRNPARAQKKVSAIGQSAPTKK